MNKEKNIISKIFASETINKKNIITNMGKTDNTTTNIHFIASMRIRTSSYRLPMYRGNCRILQLGIRFLHKKNLLKIRT